VLVPGGRVGITVWGHIKQSPGAWALAPLRLATPPKVANQAAMVALGRPGAGEDLLARAGFVDIERVDIPCVWEFADPAAYARALASTGPAYEAMQAVGEEAFMQSATDVAGERVRDGLPLRASISVVGYLARKPAAVRTTTARSDIGGEQCDDTGFLDAAAPSADVQRFYDDDMDKLGFVMNASRVWAHQPALHDALFDVIGEAVRAGSLTFRQRGILVAACASSMGDAYCSLAWGNRLAGEAGADVAGGVLRGDDGRLDPAERALARWARQITGDPNATEAGDVQALRDAGYDDAQICAITVFVGLRIAFSTVNDALGARPDRELSDAASPPVRDAVTFGRPVGAGQP
jgi:alkylhydroperoxidase family enzyme